MVSSSIKRRRLWIILIPVDQIQVYIMIFGLSTNTQSASGDARKDDANQFSKGGRVQERYTLRAT